MSFTISKDSPFFEVFLDDTKYILTFPLKAVALAEEKLGHSLRTLRDWLKLETRELPIIIEAGLQKFHPEQTAEHAAAIVEALTSDALDELHYGLCKLAFPKAMAKLEELRGTTVEQSLPNDQSGLPQSN